MITVARESFERWPDAWRIARADLEIVLVPCTGRIVRFARPGGPNALWLDLLADTRELDPWINWGGEKIWFWPQSEWPARQGFAWPPPEPTGTSAEVEALSDGLRWCFRPAPGYPFPITRTLTLPAAPGSPVRITSRTVAHAPALWSVAQIRRPDFVTARALAGQAGELRHAHMAGPRGLMPATIRSDGLWDIVCPAKKSAKLGLDADQLSAPTPAGRLVITTHVPEADAMRFPPAERAQVFTADDVNKHVPPGLPPYAELEFINPPGATELVQEWQLE